MGVNFQENSQHKITGAALAAPVRLWPGLFQVNLDLAGLHFTGIGIEQTFCLDALDRFPGVQLRLDIRGKSGKARMHILAPAQEQHINACAIFCQGNQTEVAW